MFALSAQTAESGKSGVARHGMDQPPAVNMRLSHYRTI